MALSRVWCALLPFFLFGCILPVRAEMGPCKQDEKHEILICGSGNGAAK
jgi:hypothetical protein